MNQSDVTILATISEAAEIGAPCPSNEDLGDLLGFGLSAPPAILNRLERCGLIVVERYQRSRRVTIIATGKATAPVKNTAPHWRKRPPSMPSVSTTYVQQRKPDLAREMMVAAKLEGVTLQEFMLGLIWEGWCSRQETLLPVIQPNAVEA